MVLRSVNLLPITSPLCLHSLFFSTAWTNPAPLHHSIKQHIKASKRLIFLVFMCSQWWIASQRAGRLLRSQINWHYSQDRVPIFFLTFDTDLMLPYHCEQQKAAHSEPFLNSWITWRCGIKSDSGTCKWATSDLCLIPKNENQTEDLTGTWKGA